MFHSTNVPFDESAFDESAFDESVFDESTPTRGFIPNVVVVSFVQVEVDIAIFILPILQRKRSVALIQKVNINKV